MTPESSKPIEQYKASSGSMRHGRLSPTTSLGHLSDRKQQALRVAASAVVADIVNHACVALNAGCFAAGTKLLTEQGWRKVEDIRPGERVLSRAEGQPYGEVAYKEVEECFQRTGRILHVHVAGQLIRTTAEHPFSVRDLGWTQAGNLQAGDCIATLEGVWVEVQEVWDTAE